MSFILEGVLLPTIGFFGIIANTAAILYFRRQRRVTETYHGLLLVLAIVDSLLILSCFCTFLLPILLDSSIRKSDWYYVMWILPIAHVLCTANVYLTAALSVDRYISICKPLFYRGHPWTRRGVIIPILVFSLVYNIPKFFELQWTTRNEIVNGTNITYEKISWTEMRQNKFYIQLYCLWCNVIFHMILPCSLLVTLNTCTLIEMRKNKSNNDVGKEAQRRMVQVHMAEVNIIIVVIFIICYSIRYITTISELIWVSNNDIEI